MLTLAAKMHSFERHKDLVTNGVCQSLSQRIISYPESFPLHLPFAIHIIAIFPSAYERQRSPAPGRV